MRVSNLEQKKRVIQQNSIRNLHVRKKCIFVISLESTSIYGYLLVNEMNV